MKRNWLGDVALLAITVLTPGTALASTKPTMFVAAEQGLAWWLRIKLVPYSKSDGGLDVSEINEFLKARLAQRAVSSPSDSFVPICHMNFARNIDVVSSDRATQLEIAETFKEFPQSFYESFTS